MPTWIKISLKIIGSLLLLLILILVGLSIYISTHKEKVLTLVTTELNQNLNGKLDVGGIETSFFTSFPDLAITLKNVSVKDKEWARHHHTLLDAKNFDVAVNTAALLKGTISINHIDINNASVDLFTDSTGYSNTSIFKKSSPKKDNKSESSSSAELGKFSLKNVNFTIDDQKAKKLFSFAVSELKARMDFPDSGWTANLHLNVLAKSMAFSTTHGSFIKGKVLEGDLAAGYNQKTGDINVTSSDFTIGGDDFGIIARFAVGKKPASFMFHITAPKLLWSHASQLVTPNISLKLNMFNMDSPIGVDAKIAGSFSGGGDPYLYIAADVKHNRLTIPGSVIDDCSFKGVFNNTYAKGKENGDENSIIRLAHLTGTYNHVPFAIDTGSIINLIKPIAVGNFRADFPAADLNYLLVGVAKFNTGTANMALRFNADIVNYRINKPTFAGNINLKNSNIVYVPRNLTFKNTSLSLDFTNNNLILNNIRLQSGKSIVLMQGRVDNFLNLYYNAPEKILVNWQINSPQLYLGEFLGFLNSNHSETAASTKSTSTANSGNVVKQLSVALKKAKATMHIRAANVHYFKFLATDATADLLLSKDGLQLNNVSLKHAGGFLKINAGLVQGSTKNRFTVNTVISKVNVREFFYAFDNFGLKDLTDQNLKGFLSARANITGYVNNAATLIPGSVDGMMDINLQNGVLINYQPLISIGKFAFPFRNLHNISIPVLDAHFEIHDRMITIHPFQITSSLINADIAGVYGLTNGTDITIDVPLRNPGKDSTITDAAERAKKRNKGIVVHLRAKDDGTGKVKIGRNKDHKLL
jgi:hypothetical protein